MLIRNSIQNLVVMLILSVIFGGCSNGNNHGDIVPTPVPSPTPTSLPNNIITIDVAGTIPVFANQSTSTVLYVHNNSKYNIDGINYSEVNSIAGYSGFVTPDSANRCASISARSVCALSLKTPVLSTKIPTGNTILTASYSYQNKPYSFSQSVGYNLFSNSFTAGGIYASNLNLPNVATDNLYGTVYLFGSGSIDYNVESMFTSNPNAQILQGNISGSTLQSGAIQAVEVAIGNIGINGVNTSSKTVSQKSLTANAVAVDAMSIYTLWVMTTPAGGGKTYTNSTNLNADASVVPHLVISNEVINTESTQSGELHIVNQGISPALLNNLSFSATGVNFTSLKSACGDSLPAFGSCVLPFTVSTASGYGSIGLNYSSPIGSAYTANANLTWYNFSHDNILVTLSPTEAISQLNVEHFVTATITNTGNADISGVSAFIGAISTPITANVVNSSLKCFDKNGALQQEDGYLPVAGFCTAVIALSSDIQSVGYLEFKVSGINNANSNTLNQTVVLPYDFVANAAVMQFVGPVTSSLNVMGNGESITYQVYTLTNTGNESANISTVSLINQPTYLTIAADKCSGNEIAPNGSCQITLQLGPQSSSVPLFDRATLNIKYSDYFTLAANNLSLGLTTAVYAAGEYIAISGVTVSSGFSGAGTQLNPYVLNGNNPQNQSVTITLQNQGDNVAILNGIQDSNSLLNWQINQFASTCQVASDVILQPWEQCTIVYENILYQYINTAVVNIGPVYQQNISIPTIIYSGTGSGSQYIVVPNGVSNDTIYVNSTQATVVNSINYNNTSKQLTFLFNVANMSGYAPVTLTASFENGYGTYNSGLSSPRCTSLDSTTTQLSCAVNSNGIYSATYDINSLFIGYTIDADFDVQNSSQIVTLGSTFSTIGLN